MPKKLLPYILLGLLALDAVILLGMRHDGPTVPQCPKNQWCDINYPPEPRSRRVEVRVGGLPQRFHQASEDQRLQHPPEPRQVPLARENKGHIILWMSMWFPSMISSLFSDFVKRIFKTIYYRIASQLQNISDRAFKGISDDFPRRSLLPLTNCKFHRIASRKPLGLPARNSVKNYYLISTVSFHFIISMREIQRIYLI